MCHPSVLSFKDQPFPFFDKFHSIERDLMTGKGDYKFESDLARKLADCFHGEMLHRPVYRSEAEMNAKYWLKGCENWQDIFREAWDYLAARYCPQTIYAAVVRNGIAALFGNQTI